MKAADLIVLAAAHGIDLSHVAGNASDTKGDARVRRRTREERNQGIEVTVTARGSGSRIYHHPLWSLAELGQAASGLSEIPWLAARYSWAGDQDCYWHLWSALHFHVQRTARQEDWRPQVVGRSTKDRKTGKTTKGEPHFYYAELARLVLDEDAHKHFFVAAPGLYALYLNIEDDCWSRLIAPRFEAIQGKYETWLGTARSLIQRRIAPRPESQSDVDLTEASCA